MSEYNMTHTGAELDAAIDKVQSGYILPSGTKEITENGTFDVKNYNSANVNVPQGKRYFTRIEKTVGGSDALPYSIPLSEIGFTPTAYSIELNTQIKNSTTPSSVWLLSFSADDDSGVSRSGVCYTTNKNVSTIGDGTVMQADGDNFTYTSNYAYLGKNLTYRFYFWG